MTRSLIVASVILTLSGCTVPTVGLTGVGVNADGDIVGYLEVCDERIDGVTLYVDDESVPRAGRQDAGRWTATPPVTRSASWSLRGPSPNWTAELPLADDVPDRPYAMYGWTFDNSSSTTHVSFTLADVKRLKPGQVLFLGGYDERRDIDVQRIGTPTEMRNAACT